MFTGELTVDKHKSGSVSGFAETQDIEQLSVFYFHAVHGIILVLRVADESVPVWVITGEFGLFSSPVVQLPELWGSKTSKNTSFLENYKHYKLAFSTIAVVCCISLSLYKQTLNKVMTGYRWCLFCLHRQVCFFSFYPTLFLKTFNKVSTTFPHSAGCTELLQAVRRLSRGILFVATPSLWEQHALRYSRLSQRCWDQWSRMRTWQLWLCGSNISSGLKPTRSPLCAGLAEEVRSHGYIHVGVYRLSHSSQL